MMMQADDGEAASGLWPDRSNVQWPDEELTSFHFYPQNNARACLARASTCLENGDVSFSEVEFCQPAPFRK
jgi:hypothetical protein